MRLNSLALRLFASAAIWTLIVLPITGVILVSIYRAAVERNFDARLDLYLTNLVAGSVRSDALQPVRPASLGPAFEGPFSGWYWQIKPARREARPLYTASSLLDRSLILPSESGIEASANNVRQGYALGPEGQMLRILEREIALGGATGDHYSYAVAGDSAEIERDLAEFTRLLIAALVVLGLGLVIATLFQVRFGLAPMRRIRHGLAAIRSGDAEQLEGDLPTEIAPLQEELNALLRSNREIVERARTHVGNLAHALKTPLSVITNEAHGVRTQLARKVVQQADVMRVQITHHLDRARVAARVGTVGGVTEVRPVADGLIRALNRIYKERKLKLKTECVDGAKFQGERQDLEEMVGNLLDNACKWARKKVKLNVAFVNGSKRPGKRLLIHVDDDGPGLSKSQRQTAVKRGQRLDESKPGSGLGLSIVADLAHLYNGDFQLGISPSGGLRAELNLPAA